ncbi:Ferrihemoglobin reductase [Spironucleus salmonicida]|uniref:Ferrihemoglobin reductase n=1 Tax=Spironucleus salmonicida TaxID=348837 RepID=V6LCX2_9EUKA|nr:Ferrihemoglobin reductase [Spironucleus salmonicida]KAH0575164.1 Ferrihemoglobin reductase [Spironucleus salmonicida]KAH0575168.1 Ferrihemoglobin reductase [Spironucleus salmonicida]|eukprot:EST42302.1 hypothetical protein SS50377_18171 [Spironucleus salmonicida]
MESRRISGHLFMGVQQKLPEPDMAVVNATFYTAADVLARRDQHWVSYRGMVYDLSLYVAYHPGGDCFDWGYDITAATTAAHAFVHAEMFIRRLAVGVLQGPPQTPPKRPF